MKTSRRSLEAWLLEIGSRATVCVAEENSWIYHGARRRAVVDRAAEARGRAWARERHRVAETVGLP